MRLLTLLCAVVAIQVIFVGCIKEKAGYADESITVDNQPDKEKKFF
jgi:hypothetical protein